MGAGSEQEEAGGRFAARPGSFGDGAVPFMGKAMEAYLEK